MRRCDDARLAILPPSSTVLERAGTTVTLAKVEVTCAVAGMEATDAEAGVIGATGSEAGVVAAEAVAVEGITWAEEEMGVEEAGFAAC